MKNELPDRTVILILISTLIFIFFLIFSLRPSQNQLQPSMEWRDSTNKISNYSNETREDLLIKF